MSSVSSEFLAQLLALQNEQMVLQNKQMVLQNQLLALIQKASTTTTTTTTTTTSTTSLTLIKHVGWNEDTVGMVSFQNMPMDITSAEIRNIFDECGVVLDVVSVTHTPYTGRGCGKIIFNDKRSAMNAAREFHLAKVNGRIIRVLLLNDE